MFKAMRNSGCVAAAVSEETAEIVEFPLDREALGDNKTDGYAVAFDPLDGSTVVECNFAVGTIFGIWPGKKLKGIYGRDMVAAGMC